jgi:hypothetical protein
MTSQVSQTDSSSTTREQDFGRPFRLTASDLIGDMLWPKLLRVPSLTLRPDRIGLAILIILLIGLIDQTLAAIASTEESPATPVVEMLGARFVQGQSQALESVSSLAIGDALLIGWNGAWRAVTTTFNDAPWRSSFVLPVSFLIYITFAVGISRMAVDDFARGKSTKWTEALAWSLQGFVSALVAHLVPIIVMLLIIGVLSVGGFALLGVPYLNVVGAVLSVFGVLIALVGVLVLIGFGLGAPMLSPAIATEGFDGIDAMQRVVSYIFCKPGRFAIYSFILFLQFAVVASIAAALASATSGLASWGMGLIFGWAGMEYGQAIAVGSATEGAAADVVAFMLKLPALVAGGFMLCYWISGWSVQYLLLRQATDGQDVTDIFVPGDMEARIDRALASRVAGIDANQSEEG